MSALPAPAIEPLRNRRESVELSRLLFGDLEGATYDPERPSTPNERMHCVYEGDRLIAKSGSTDMAQFFGGRSVAMGGLCSVGVAPDRRGRGLAKAVVSASLLAMHERGDLLSSQFPTTAGLYRGLGYEFGGVFGSTRVPLHELPTSDELDDRAKAIEFTVCNWGDVTHDAATLWDSMARPHNGWQDHRPLFWAQTAFDWDAHDTGKFLVRGVRDGETVAVVAYQHEAPLHDGIFSLWLEQLLVSDGAALRAAFAFLAGHGTTVDTVKTTLPVEYFGWALRGGEHLAPHKSGRAMTRLIDTAGAVAARGYSPAVTATIPLSIADPLIPTNVGDFVLEVADGAGQLTPGGDGSIVVDIGALSAIYTGVGRPAAMARNGQLKGGTSAQLAELAAVFAGPIPVLNSYF